MSFKISDDETTKENVSLITFNSLQAAAFSDQLGHRLILSKEIAFLT